MFVRVLLEYVYSMRQAHHLQQVSSNQVLIRHRGQNALSLRLVEVAIQANGIEGWLHEDEYFLQKEWRRAIWVRVKPSFRIDDYNISSLPMGLVESASKKASPLCLIIEWNSTMDETLNCTPVGRSEGITISLLPNAMTHSLRKNNDEDCLRLSDRSAEGSDGT